MATHSLNHGIILDLRRQAAGGRRAPDLLRDLAHRLGADGAYGSILARYFKEAFHLPVRVVAPIGGWGPDNQGEITDDALQEMLHPHMMQTKKDWADG